MKRKTIDAWHEARMTFVQVLMPTIVGLYALDGRYPDLKYKIADKIKNITNKK